MPWFCAYCSRWSPSKDAYCTSCGRSGLGRLCRKCKTPISGNASFCSACGGDRFIESAVKRFAIPRPVRLVAVITVGLVLWLLLPPLLRLLWTVLVWLWEYVLGLAMVVFVLWVMTGFLPRPAGQWVRRGAWAGMRFLGRCVRNLFG